MNIRSELVLNSNKHDRYKVTVDEYRAFRKTGFLTVKNLLTAVEIDELRAHTDDLMMGRLPEQCNEMEERDSSSYGAISVQSLEAPPAHLTPEEKVQYFLRIHMLHRKLPIHEKYLLHPKVLDVLDVLIGPDILALQSMLFLKPAGKPGQGWHQDSYYIPTQPDTLCGAWIAIDDADEMNGAMWMASGSSCEPVYPPKNGYGYGDRNIESIRYVDGVSNPVDSENDLSAVADCYPQVLVSAKAGDVVFFGGHILHRSKMNFSLDRLRRSFVGHYCNARSFTQWGYDDTANVELAKHSETGMTNGSHILARGDTHLPFARPKFGTYCAALLSPEERKTASELTMTVMGDMESGLMDVTESEVTPIHHD